MTQIKLIDRATSFGRCMHPALALASLSPPALRECQQPTTTVMHVRRLSQAAPAILRQAVGRKTGMTEGNPRKELRYWTSLIDWTLGDAVASYAS